MLDIGVDFGSTYTTVAIYRHDIQKSETITLSEGESSLIPTVYTCRRDGTKPQIGWSAKENQSPMMRKFRAFKMLLSEDDQDTLTERQYDSVFTPEEITRRYLTELLSRILEREGCREIQNLVVGAPEVWYDAFSTIDGRTKLRNICRSLPFFSDADQGTAGDRVRIISEPAAACAFFARNYTQKTGKPFDGHILLIDYGGGTLDISLTEIIPSAGGNFELRVLNHAGAGENEQKGEIGKAGIIYMESLTKQAIRESMPGTSHIPADDDFFETVNAVERALMGNTDVIEDVFSEYGTSPEDLTEDRMEDEYYFTKVYYRGQKIMLSYCQMAQAYDHVIRPIFRDKMEEFIQYMNSVNIAWKNRTNDRFKIILVGGFGNFALVKEQMKECFEIGHNDRRRKDIGISASDSEKSIAMGCALLSANVVELRNTAPIGIGMLTISPNGEKKKYNLSFGLEYHQDIEFGKEYIQKKRGSSGPEYIHLSVPDRFLVDMGKGPLPLAPKSKFRGMLQQALADCFLAYFGFSIDASGVLTIYIHEYDHIAQKEVRHVSLELASYKELFETQSIDEKEMEAVRASL